MAIIFIDKNVPLKNSFCSPRVAVGGSIIPQHVWEAWFRILMRYVCVCVWGSLNENHDTSDVEKERRRWSGKTRMGGEAAATSSFPVQLLLINTHIHWLF